MVRNRLALCTLLAAVGGCRPTLAPRVPAPASDPSEAWERVLGEVVTPSGLVDYDALEARRDVLDRYVAWVGRPRDLDRDTVRHAFLLNAYDALVLFGVLEDGRPATVMDDDGWLPWPGGRFFDERAFLVDGRPTSLSELLHEQIRQRVLDYRDHAAVQSARAGDPPRRPELYRPQGLGKQLDRQMARWLGDDARGVRIEGDEAVFSPVFDRYAWDFSFQTVGDDPCTIAARYTTGAKRDALRRLAADGCPHRFLEPDDRLDDAAVVDLPDLPPLDAVDAPAGEGPERDVEPP